jgi:hypothetical protein
MSHPQTERRATNAHRQHLAAVASYRQLAPLFNAFPEVTQTLVADRRSLHARAIGSSASRLGQPFTGRATIPQF